MRVQPATSTTKIGGRLFSRVPQVAAADVWVVLALSAPLVVTLLSRMGTTDLAYHLRTGSSLLETGAIPRADLYTFGAAGRPWLDQQWGAQVFLALAFRIGSWHGLAILRAALAVTTFGFLFAACRARGASLRAGALLTLGALVMCNASLSLRPQSFGFALFAVSVWIVVGRSRHPRRMLLLPILAIAWANIHGSFVLAPVLATGAWLEDALEHRRSARRSMGIALATGIATLIGPYGAEVWRYAFTIGMSEEIRRSITEWQPTTITSPWGALLFASAAVVAGFLARRREPTPWTDLVWLGAAFVIALPAIRGIAWWGLTAPVVVAGLLPATPTNGRERGSRANAAIIACILGVASMMVARDAGTDPGTGTSARIWQVSQYQIDAVRSSLVPGSRLFVAQPSASWFEFGLPSMPVFIDSRIELFPERAWHDYYAVVRGDDGWQDILDRWDVDAVITDGYTVELRDRMEDEAGWRRIYGDANGAVFVRS
jgi:hypothetical protein